MRKLGLVVSMLVVPFLVAPASAAPGDQQSIPLPVDFQPEGITSDGTTFYAGSLRDGDIYRGDLVTGAGSVWIDTADRAAVGLLADPAHGYLWVSGGPDGRARAYDLGDGSLVAELQLAPPSPPGFPTVLINDVTVTDDAAYFTDTFGPHIFKVPIAGDGTIGAPSTITVTGPAAAIGGFGMNGIRALPGGLLLVNLTTAGILATVDPETGASQAVDLGSDSLVPGTPDGMIRSGRTVWVVENFANTVVEIRMAADWSSGRIVSRTTSPLFHVPTTVTRHGQDLALVNGRFDLGLPPPFSPGAPPGTEFDVVVIRQG